MVRNVFIVVSMSSFGSWLVDKAVSRLVRRLRIMDRFSCGAGGEEVCGGPEDAFAYVSGGFFRRGGDGRVVWIG